MAFRRVQMPVDNSLYLPPEHAEYSRATGSRTGRDGPFKGGRTGETE